MPTAICGSATTPGCFGSMANGSWRGTRSLSTAVPSAAVRSLTCARDGSLWIGFGGNAGVGHLVNGRLRQYAAADGLGPGAVVVLIEDRDGGVWVGSNSGLYRFRNDRFEKQAVGTSGQPACRLERLHRSAGALLVGTASGLLKSDPPYAQFHSGARRPTMSCARLLMTVTERSGCQIP